MTYQYIWFYIQKAGLTNNPLTGGAAMTKEQTETENDAQWILIEHEPKECGSIITINVTKFTDAYRKHKNGKPILICPSCLEPIIGTPELNALFESYETLRKGLGPTAKIRQVQPKHIDTIKDLHKLFDKS